MKNFDIYLAYVEFSDYSGGKFRPVLILFYANEEIYIYPVTSKYKNKSDKIKANYFKINDLKNTGLTMVSYIDTGNLIVLSNKRFSFKKIGFLSEKDKKRLLEFIQNK